MKVTAKQIWIAGQALVGLNQALPAAVSYRFSKILGEFFKLEEERQKLIIKHGDKDDKGNFSVEPEKLEQFTKEWEELMKEEIVIPISLTKLNNLEGVQIRADQMFALAPFIEEPTTDG